MNSSNRYTFIALAGIVLAMVSLACNAAGMSRMGAPVPTRSIEASADALASFNSKWRNLSLATPSGPFSITFDEPELTSAVNAALDKAEADSGQAIPLSNVQVHLREGAVDVYGQAKIDPLTVNGRITVVPSISSSGLVELTVTSVEFGPLEVDQALLDQVINSVEQSINEPIQTSPSNITLTSVAITDTLLTISGTVTP